MFSERKRREAVTVTYHRCTLSGVQTLQQYTHKRKPRTRTPRESPVTLCMLRHPSICGRKAINRYGGSGTNVFNYHLMIQIKHPALWKWWQRPIMKLLFSFSPPPLTPHPENTLMKTSSYRTFMFLCQEQVRSERWFTFFASRQELYLFDFFPPNSLNFISFHFPPPQKKAQKNPPPPPSPLLQAFFKQAESTVS